jgi:pyridoxal phosphate enzyme (YggS family)
MPDLAQTLLSLQNALAACIPGGRPPALLAVSKTQSAERVAECAALGQRAFGENYVQEAIAKITALANLDLVWHLIGPLQSNKCKTVAEHFDWVQTVDREKIVPLLAQYRPASKAPLNVLIQVNIDEEPGKSGCSPDAAARLADLIDSFPRLRLRGLMAIPDPAHSADGVAFERMQALYRTLQQRHPQMDTLSMGMSDDYPVAIRHGATLVRVGSALFGPRPSHSEDT